jgi:hypothetical protein
MVRGLGGAGRAGETGGGMSSGSSWQRRGGWGCMVVAGRGVGDCWNVWSREVICRIMEGKWAHTEGLKGGQEGDWFGGVKALTIYVQ